MAIVSSTERLPTITGWKRRSSAASFSMCLRYSSSVVAPTARSSPRASIGLSRLAASTAPSAAPAPTIVCSSSRNRMIWPSRVGDLLEHRLEPVLELAAVLGTRDQRADVERDHAAVAQRVGDVAGDDALGEALDDRGLADAGLADQDGVVLGAPREHLDHAADLVIAPDDRVELALLGQPGSGRARRSRAPGTCPRGSGRSRGGARGPPGRPRRAGRARRRRRYCGSAASASSRCSVETYSSPIPRASSSARLSRSISCDPSAGAAEASPVTVGSASAASLARRRTRSGSAPARRSTGTTIPPSCSSRASSRCAGVTSGLRRAPASRCAAARASWDLTVKRSACIENLSGYIADRGARPTTRPRRERRRSSGRRRQRRQCPRCRDASRSRSRARAPRPRARSAAASGRPQSRRPARRRARRP